MKTKWNLLLAVVIGGAFMAAAGTADAINLESWDNQINKPSRFKVLSDFGGEAVLDKETQLVWEQAPHGQLRMEEDPTTFTWLEAQESCNTRTVGGRKGWRLPGIQELASLFDPNNPGGNPDLPPGHPFSNVQSSGYWSATTGAFGPSVAWVVDFSNGGVFTDGKAATVFVWCARGGQGVDPQ
jgi:hypothetical protein